MSVSVVLVPILLAVLAALITAAVAIRRRHQSLLRQREALQKQRAAAHVREIALATHMHTGRVDAALTLLQLSSDMLEEAVRLAPQEESIRQMLDNLRQLMGSLQIDDKPAMPVPNPDSQADLTQASMQLTEALRLLGRLEVRAEMDGAELRSMQHELRRIQRSLEFRTRMRRELEIPSIPAPQLVPDPDFDPPRPTDAPSVRANPH